MPMISNAYAGRAMMDENHMRLIVEDSDKNVSEIWVYRDANLACKFSLEENGRVIKEAAIDWDRATALISADRRFDIEYEYYELPVMLIATSIRFRDDTPRKSSIIITDKSTDGLELFVNGPRTMAADVGVHIKGTPNALWMTLRTECWEYYKKPEIGIKRTGNMQAYDILRKAANGEYKTYEIKFNYHIEESVSWRLMVDEVYIKYEEKEEEENMGRYAYRTFFMSHAVCDWLNNKAEVSDKNGNTYSFDDSTEIYLRDGSTDQNKKITFVRAANGLLHNRPDSIQIGAYIVTDSRRITLMYIYCDSEFEKLKEENERLRDKIDKQKALLNSMYGVSALGWSDMYPTSMMYVPSRSDGMKTRFKELAKFVDQYAKTHGVTFQEAVYALNDVPIWTDDGLFGDKKEPSKFLIPKIKKVLYREPAVIVFWEDDTKTVVRAQDGEPYDKEKGLAMAISKKALGNDRDYYETFIRSKAVPKPKKGKKTDKKE